MRKHDGKIAFMCALALLLSLHADCALAAEAPGMVRCDGRPVYVYAVDSHEVYGRECRVIGVLCSCSGEAGAVHRHEHLRFHTHPDCPAAPQTLCTHGAAHLDLWVLRATE